MNTTPPQPQGSPQEQMPSDVQTSWDWIKSLNKPGWYDDRLGPFVAWFENSQRSTSTSEVKGSGESARGRAKGEAPCAWICTDLDSRADVGMTKKAAQERAGEGCTEFIPMFADSAPPAQPQGLTDTCPYCKSTDVGWLANDLRKGYRYVNGVTQYHCYPAYVD